MEDVLRELRKKEEILDTINELFLGTDARDWDRVRAVLAHEVHFDMKSMTGSPPAALESGEIVRSWEEGLRGLKAIHHQTGNFRVRIDGDSADASCYGTASHYRPNPSGRNTRTFVGSYDFHLARSDGRWRIDLFRFNLKYLDGNLQLDEEG
jgi:SnoaL-like domain